MKIYTYINVRSLLLLGLGIVAFSACERDLSDDVEFATFPSNGDIFIDAPVGLTDEFFDSFDPAIGANTEGFGTDDDVAFEGSSSIRIDVPAPDDPNGSFIGGVFLDRGAGRDLTGFDALTFYVKGSTTATIDEVGFGSDFEEDKFAVGLANVRLSTDWRKVIIPIPDPSKLVQERGMFRFSTGTLSTDGIGFTFWIDELRFEKLGTIAQPSPAILNGEIVAQQSFNGAEITLSGLTQRYNLPNGQNQTVAATPSYFTFASSNPQVAIVNEAGVVTILQSGLSEITATLAGVRARGALNVESLGNFQAAPAPTVDPANVISIFSDTYTNVPVDFFNGLFGGQSTQGGADLELDGNTIIQYTNLDFVATSFENPPVDASGLTHFHVDLFISENIQPGDFIRIELVDFGGDGFGNIGDTGGSVTLTGDDLASRIWISLDLELTTFTGPAGGGMFPGPLNTNNLAQIVFASGGVSTLLVDNMYFYSE